MLYVLWNYDIFDNFYAYVHTICKDCIQNIIKAEIVFKSDDTPKKYSF
jgi:hypothetical protein